MTIGTLSHQELPLPYNTELYSILSIVSQFVCVLASEKLNKNRITKREEKSFFLWLL